MKNTILTITFILLSFISNSQTRYYPPNFYSEYLLDSLSIPYLPINLRVSGQGFSESYKQKFMEKFGNDFDFIPKTSNEDIPIEFFVFNKNFASERDDIYHQLMSGFEFEVLSKSIVPVNGILHKSIWIVEVYGKATDQYSAILYYENYDGKFQTIFDNFLPIPPESISKNKYQ